METRMANQSLILTSTDRRFRHKKGPSEWAYVLSASSINEARWKVSKSGLVLLQKYMCAKGKSVSIGSKL